MSSLFEKEEKKDALNRLKVDLISRYFPFSMEEILQYKSVLNFGRYQLMNNEFINWDIKMIGHLVDKIDWTSLWKIKNIRLDYDFFKTYETQIDFDSIRLSNCIIWSDEFHKYFGDKFDWSGSLILKEPLSKIENLRRYKDKLNWRLVSLRIKLDFNQDIIDEFSDLWVWSKLSANKNIPITVEFIKSNLERIDFNELSQNPNALAQIYKYPLSKKWDWEKVIMNPAVNFNKDSFDFMFSYFKVQYEQKEFSNPILKSMALSAFLHSVFSSYENDISYFLQDKFMKHIPWKILCKVNNTKLTLEFIEKHKDKLNFKEPHFIRAHANVFTEDFIENNLRLFDTSHYSFYYLPITINLLEKLGDEINWNYLSSSEKLDWNWDFVIDNFHKFNRFKLAENKGVYEKLIINDKTSNSVLQFLNNEMVKK